MTPPRDAQRRAERFALASRVRLHAIPSRSIFLGPRVPPMPRAILAAAVCLTLAVPAAAQETKPADPAPLQLTDPAGSQADDGGAGDQVAAPGRQRHEPQRAQRRQLRRVEGQPLPTCPTRSSEGREKVTTAEQWWTKRRPEIVEDFDREVYGRVPKDVPKVTWEVTEHDRGEGRRHPGRHQEARGPRRQFEVPADQGRHPAHADDAGRGQGAGAGDDGVRLRRIRPAAGRPAGEGGHAEGDAQGRSAARASAAAARRGSSRCSPRAGATPSSSPTASRPTTARG